MRVVPGFTQRSAPLTREEREDMHLVQGMGVVYEGDPESRRSVPGIQTYRCKLGALI